MVKGYVFDLARLISSLHEERAIVVKADAKLFVVPLGTKGVLEPVAFAALTCTLKLERFLSDTGLENHFYLCGIRL
jgi:hypothetical protein